MTSPSTIIDVVSDRLGVARATVAMQDRMLVTSGHRQITGRGRSARSTPADAAALILAVAATPLSGPGVKETAMNFERYAGLVATDESGQPASFEIKPLFNLGAGHTLQVGLAGIIAMLAEGNHRASDLIEVFPKDEPEDEISIGILVELETPTPKARIHFEIEQRKSWATVDGETRQLELLSRAVTRLDYLPSPGTLENYLETLPRLGTGLWRPSDLTQTRRFSHETIQPVADLFRAEKTK
ncbi:hypothetical protein [Bradyrhizobium sp. CW10]|uniref:hypothetical protein n=1 Tax=Bradyrhizobium sp. CW10 TaxID=2782683 RepID=UPI001FF8EEA3|nr:hypothetical protein [Bradyrhizobium sp. CW10]MCK1472831.1 hypothetical protein [Bradyrhizobium sp. CW10]